MATWDTAMSVEDVIAAKTVTEQQILDAIKAGDLKPIQPPYNGYLAGAKPPLSAYWFNVADAAAWTP